MRSSTPMPSMMHDFPTITGGMLNRMMSYSKDEKLIILYSSIVKREAFSYVETGLSEFARQAKNQIKNNDAIKAAPKKTHKRNHEDNSWDTSRSQIIS